MKELWYGFEKIDFDFEGFNATLVFPKTADKDKNWSLKMEYKEAFPETEIELLNRGFHVAFLQNDNRWATKFDCDKKARFAKFLNKEYGLNKKLVPIGFSCGGAHAINFAGFYPELVKCVYIDAPVLNYISYPGKFNKGTGRLNDYNVEYVYENEFVKAYPGITRVKLFSFDNHPISKIPTLIEKNIPILLTYGDQDMSLDANEHWKIMIEEYKDRPDLLQVIVRVCQGHHPHGLLDKSYIVADFICEHI